MRIGEVHSLLRQQFPDLELSKIRYYEEQGLVRPGRTRKGYRLYSERDVACLREAIRLAVEEFLPLRVVRVRLIEAGLLDDVSSSTRQVARPTASASVSMTAPSKTPAPASTVVATTSVATVEPMVASEFARVLEISTSQLDLLVRHGLAVASSDDRFDAADLESVAASAALLSRGLDIRQVAQIRRLADRYAGIVEEFTSPLRRPGATVSAEDAAAITADVAADVASALTGLLRHVATTIARP
jgi:DNA-binding transcriptional MerR regulator